MTASGHHGSTVVPTTARGGSHGQAVVAATAVVAVPLPRSLRFFLQPCEFLAIMLRLLLLFGFNGE